MQTDSGSVTRILQAASEGDKQAAEDLIPLVYEELSRSPKIGPMVKL
jgi:hypothetical protein